MGEYRDLLERIAERSFMPEPAMDRLLRRKARRRRNPRIEAGVVGAVLAVALIAAGLAFSRQPKQVPAGISKYGIFSTVRGDILFAKPGSSFSSTAGLWAVDPSGSTDAFQFSSINVIPIAWSPDGTMLLTGSFGSGLQHGPWKRLWKRQDVLRLGVLKADGSLMQLPLISYMGVGSFAPDGTQVYGYCPPGPGDSNFSVCSARIAGGRADRLVPVNGRAATVSPDGREIAYVGVGGVRIMNIDGTGDHLVARRRTMWPAVESVVWSPDAQHLAIWAKRPVLGRVYIVDTDGSGVTPLSAASDATPTNVYWSSDGSEVAYEWNGLRVAALDGTDKRFVGFYPPGPWAGTDGGAG